MNKLNEVLKGNKEAIIKGALLLGGVLLGGIAGKMITNNDSEELFVDYEIEDIDADVPTEE